MPGQEPGITKAQRQKARDNTMSRTKQASLGRRLGRLEAMLKSVSDREPTYEEFHAARGRIGALVALEAVDGMLAEARQAEEARRYTPYPPAMLEWCREELQLRAQP